MYLHSFFSYKTQKLHTHKHISANAIKATRTLMFYISVPQKEREAA